MNTPTPETDAEIRNLCEGHDGDLFSDFNSLSNFARKLERERDELRKELAHVTDMGMQRCIMAEQERDQLRAELDGVSREVQASGLNAFADTPLWSPVATLRVERDSAKEAMLRTENERMATLKERDQLRKVCDELMDIYYSYGGQIHLHKPEHLKAIEDYNNLPNRK